MGYSHIYQSQSIYQYGHGRYKEYVYFFYFKSISDYLAMIIFSFDSNRLGQMFRGYQTGDYENKKYRELAFDELDPIKWKYEIPK